MRTPAAVIPVVLALLNQPLHAAPPPVPPAINYTSGVVTHGSTLTIVGSGFGTKGVAAPMRYDDFESGTNGAALGGIYTRYDNNVTFSNARLRTNSTMSAECAFIAAPDDSGFPCSGDYSSNFGIAGVNSLNHLYIDAWYYGRYATPASRNHKIFRIHSQTYSPNLYMNVYCPAVGVHMDEDGAGTSTSFGFDLPGTYGPGAMDYLKNRWTHIQAYFEHSNGSAQDGKMRIWVDDVKYEDVTNWQNAPDGTTYWSDFYFGNYLGHGKEGACPISAGAYCSADNWTYWDNAYIDTTQARVEIGDAPTYANCTEREIQIPSAWSDASITITLNQGAFSSLAGKYLYVTDRYGYVNTTPFQFPTGGGGCPFVLTETGSGFSVENSILGRSEDGARGRFVSDAYPLLAKADARGRIRLRVAELESETDEIDEVKLGRVEVPAGDRLATDSSGRPVLMHQLEIPIRSAQWSGRQLPFQSPVAPGEAFRGEAGDSAEFDLQPGQSVAINSRLGVGVQLLAKQHAPSLPRSPQGGAAGITIRVSPDAEGEKWITLGSVIPREFWSTDILPGTSPAGQDVRRIRVIWHTPHTLGWIGIVETAEVQPKILPCLTARHSAAGSVLGELNARDGRIVTLRPEEFVELEFDAGEASTGTQYVLLANGRYYRTDTQKSTAVPAAYALAQNRPNPFNPETSIEFDLPSPSSVTLRVYSVAGLLIRTIIDKAMPAGFHMARWNARDDRGAPLPSGVYFYELRAGAFEQRRRMVLLR